MGSFDTSNLSELIKNLDGLEKSVDDIQCEMLEAAGTEFETAWKNGIRQSGHVDTGDMLNSVKAKVSKKTKKVTIAPTGKDRHGVINAKKAFVLHYGKSGILGDRFVDDIEEKGKEAAIGVMLDVYHAELKKKGVI